MLCTMKRWNKWKHETSIFPKFEVIFLGTRSRFYMTSPSSSSTASFDIHTHTYIYMLFLFRVVFSVCLLFALFFFFWVTVFGVPPWGKKRRFFGSAVLGHFSAPTGGPFWCFFGLLLLLPLPSSFFFFCFFFFFLCMFASSQHLRRQKIRRVIN